MFRKLFSSPAAGQPKHQKRIQGFTSLDSTKATNLETNVATHDAERQMYRFEMPEQERGMTDLINSHQSGSRFQYVALTGSDIEEHSSRIRRLIQLTPKINKSEIPMKDLPRLRLTEDSEKFSLKQAIPLKGKEFIFLSRATLIYTPLSSFTDDYSRMSVLLLDTRMRNRPSRASVKSNTNILSKIEFSLDHCIPRQDIDQLSLMVVREQTNMNHGHMWGVIQVQLEILESDYPFVENLKETSGVLSMPSTGLETFERDPMHLDITVHNNHRLKMKDIYDVGEIANETTPMKENKGKINYAKSTGSGLKKSAMKPTQNYQNVVPDTGNWENVRNSHVVMIPDDEISIDPEDSDGDTNLTSDIEYNTKEIQKGFDSLENALAKRLENVKSGRPISDVSNASSSFDIPNPKPRKAVGFKVSEI